MLPPIGCSCVAYPELGYHDYCNIYDPENDPSEWCYVANDTSCVQKQEAWYIDGGYWVWCALNGSNFMFLFCSYFAAESQ